MASEEITILLLLEVIDKASGVIGKIGQAFTGLGDALQKAADISARTAEEQQLLDDKATAATAAWTEATNVQTAAQQKLAEANRAVTAAQAQAVEWTQMQRRAEEELYATVGALTEEEQFSLQVIRESAAAAAEAVKTSTAEQIAALDELQGAEKEVSVRSQEMAASQDAASTETGLGAAALGGLKAAAATTAIGVGALSYLTAKAAANFQSLTTTLATSGGEMDKTGALLEKSRQGILDLAQSTGTATDQLVKGFYMIGSAGFDAAHGGLDVLKAAAEGAKAENSDLMTVSNALTTVMLDYPKSFGSAAQAMDAMIAVVQNGKTTTQALASALSSVLPFAQKAGLGFDQIGGAIATMTAQGMTADQATMDLANTINALQKPSNLATQLMQSLGIDSNKLSMNLGKNGLTGTFNTLLQAIAAHTHNGQVMLNTWYNSAAAAQDLKTMVASMTPDMQNLANGFLSGSVSALQFRNALYQLPPIQRNAMMQFETLANKADGFNQQLKAGNPDAITFNAAMGTMLNGATGLKTALMLTGTSAGMFSKNVQQVGDAAKSTGTDVNGWSLIQGNFNQQLSQLKETVQVAAIRIGTALLPAITKVVEIIQKIVQPMADWISKHQKLAAILMIAVGALSALLVVILSAIKIFKMVQLAIEGVGAALDFLALNPIVGMILVVALAAYLIVTHWSTVKKWLEDFWGWIVKAAKAVGDFFVKVWQETVGIVKTIWGGIQAAWDATGGKAITWIETQFSKIAEPVEKEWHHIVSDLQSIWQSLSTIWDATGGKLVSYISRHWQAIEDATKVVWNAIYANIKATVDVIVGLLKGAWDLIREQVQVTWDFIKGVIEAAWDEISGLAKGALDILEHMFRAAWDVIVGVVKMAWDVIKLVINTALDLLKDEFQFFADLFTGKWSKLWGDVEKVFKDMWDNIWGFFKSFFTDLWNMVTGAVSAIWDGFVGATEDSAKGIWNAMVDIYHTVVRMFDDAGTWLWNAGKAILEGLLGGLKAAWNDVTGFVGGIGDWISKHKGPIEVDMQLLVPHGQSIMQGLMDGLKSQMPKLQATLGQVTSTVTASVNPAIRTSGALAGLGSAPASASGQPQIVITNDLRESRIMSDRDMDLLTQKIGNRLATQLLPAGGVRIRS